MATRTISPAPAAGDSFIPRHVGPSAADQQAMLSTLGYPTLDAFIDAVVPEAIRFRSTLQTGAEQTEAEVLASLRQIASRNRVYRSYIGMGYYGTHTPNVILRNIMENPAWYTAYTPYQAEIAQGRLEALLNYQTLVIDLTGLEIANASLLDEGTAAAEAMALAFAAKGNATRNVFLVASDCHAQTISVVQARAEARGIVVRVVDAAQMAADATVFGVLLQYPGTDGAVVDYRGLCEQVHATGALTIVASDLLALCLLTPPGEWGADMVVGSSQRFGVPMGYGGPHAAFFATRDEFKRLLPGRIIGMSRDIEGTPALRMALQTREQHIRREKATSNVCTAQVLLAVMASMYAVYHGPKGLVQIAERVHGRAATLAAGLEKLGFAIMHEHYFDTIRVEVGAHGQQDILAAADSRQMNLRVLEPGTLTIAVDETTTAADIADLWAVFNGNAAADFSYDDVAAGVDTRYDERFRRVTPFLTHPTFHRYHSETEMLRYLYSLQAKDFSLVHGMIPLGSCTMKLNATAEMIPVTWPEFGQLHPFAPRSQAEGYAQMFEELEHDLAEVTGFAGVSLQPNAGSQGEYAGLLVIRAYHEARKEGHRTVCLIPQSAHGTNPASAVMAGFSVVVVKTDTDGNIDVADLEAKAAQHAANLGALMVTYPSTHGVFEESIKDITAIIHRHGGQVYMDGANMNAMVGIARPGDLGADVCHLNLHKTFCIPHGGGGPGMGPIGVASQLVPFLPTHPVVSVSGDQAIGPVSAAPWGSASILPISYVYIKMMGGEGLALATKIAILNANYIAKRLEAHYPVLYRGQHGLVAHECILDTRNVKSAGIEAEDIAKRLMDYGFHAPTLSFPVAGTLMVEPTESESKAEIDRFIEAMIGIREEIAAVERGEADREDNVLKNAPHTATHCTSDDWSHPYTRQQAAYPTAWTRDRKFWPAVRRVESAFGDRNLVCACPPIEDYAPSA
ncbi:MAG TPA: glycine dehydrogenase (aminomethyl-transferring) [Gemmatimonas aurantiaca]|nr:aminomethyl-transferring glycine dehydrogenase [Gemmatimonas aurantiaca]HCT56583.1 glycine dehydrogenase (aminomethyl-transferring) [Gemmatimonas aurantiaca]